MERFFKCYFIICLLSKVSAEGWTCHSTSRVFSRVNTDAVLQFNLSGHVNQNIGITFTIRFFDSKIQGFIVYNNGAITTSEIPGVNITGDLAGNVNVTKSINETKNAGIYYISSTALPTTCVCLYILGTPTPPLVSVTNNSSVGGKAILKCSSTSTTTPSNHSLSFMYNWQVDSNVNPSGSRYSYSTNRNTLTLSDIVKDDANKQFTCTATEDVSGGYTSSRSDFKSIDVHYGPENVRFSPEEKYYERNENTTMEAITCNATCHPACSFKWTKVGDDEIVTNNNVLSLGRLSSSKAGTYRCMANRTVDRIVTMDLTVHVIYGPYAFSTELKPSDKEHIRNEGGQTLPDISCYADCFPNCTYSWAKLPQGESTTTTIHTTDGVLSLGSLKREDAGNYTCKATNPKKSSSSYTTKTVEVHVRYGPETPTISVNVPYTVKEGNVAKDVRCFSDCYPGCSFIWFNVTGGSKISSNEVISLGKVNRYMAGSYKCRSSNTASEYEHSSENTLEVIVQYAPDVEILIVPSNFTEGANVTLNCTGLGFPTTNNFISFTQMVKGRKVENKNKPLHGTIHFPVIHFQDTGTYTCTLNNNITDINGILDQTGSKDVIVEVHPKVLADEMRFTGATGGKAEIKVPVYSYPELLHVEVTRYDGIEIKSNDKYNISRHRSSVETYFYNTQVALDGIKIEISILNLEEDDFGNYSLKLTNRLGSNSVLLFVIAEGPPSPPLNFHYLIDREPPTFVWEKNFNGGLEQSFVIQTASVETEQWINHTNIKEKDQQYQINSTYYRAEIRLQPGIYKARILANNSRGYSEPVDLEFTFNILKEETETTSLPIAAIAGGSVSAIVMVVVIGVVVLVVLRRMKGNKDGSKTQLNKSNSPDDNDEDEVQTVNPMYVSADEVKSGDNTYAMPVKKKKGPSGGDVYAMVDKKRDFGKKDIKKNKQSNHVTDADIYENASDTSSKRKAKKSTQEKRKAYEENPYENPNANEVNRKQKIVNKEGLIYADLVFNEQSKGQKKLVIHGIDDTTEYVEVDFNKKADPLPDSDEEENNTKK